MSLSWRLGVGLLALLASSAAASADVLLHRTHTTPAPAGFFPPVLPVGTLGGAVIPGASGPLFAPEELASSGYFPQTLTVPRFDPTMGTLTSVRVDGLGYAMANLRITNDETNATVIASGSLHYTLTIGDSTGGTLLQVTRSDSVSGTIAPGSTLDIPWQGYYESGYLTSDSLAEWIGEGNVSFPVTFHVMNAVSVAGGDNSMNAEFRGYGQVQVTYAFIPNIRLSTAEPTTLAILGGLLLGGLIYIRGVRLA